MKKSKPIIFLFLLLFIICLIISGCSTETEKTIVFKNVDIVPMTDEITLANMDVTIRDNIIADIQKAAVGMAENAEVIDCKGYYLMPGLCDMHVHMDKGWDTDEWPVCPLNLYLAKGVTTIRDMGRVDEDVNYVLKIKKMIDENKRLGPGILTSGQILFSSPLENPQARVMDNQEKGFDFIKIYSYLSQNDMIDSIKEAKKLGIYCTGHIPFEAGLERFLDAGMDEIAHVEELAYEFLEFERDNNLEDNQWIPYIVENTDAYIRKNENIDFDDTYGEELDRILNMLKTSNTKVATTMILDDVVSEKLFDKEAFLNARGTRYLPERYISEFKKGEDKHLKMFDRYGNVVVYKKRLDEWILKNIHENDIELILGTDSGTFGLGIVPGFSAHEELRILTENGLTPFEALKTATVNAGKVIYEITGNNNFGTIEKGKRADLVLVRENPMESIDALENIEGVMVNGTWLSKEVLKALLQ